MILWSILLGLLGLSEAPPQQSRAANGCFVELRADRVHFIFPPETRRSWLLHPRDPDALVTTVEYLWQVQWPAPGAPVIDSRRVGLMHHVDVQRQGTFVNLKGLIAKGALTTLSDHAFVVDHVGLVETTDSAASASIRGQRVVLTLTGRSTLARYLTPRPDSVTFTFVQFGDTTMTCRATMPPT